MQRFRLEWIAVKKWKKLLCLERLQLNSIQLNKQTNKKKNDLKLSSAQIKDECNIEQKTQKLCTLIIKSNFPLHVSHMTKLRNILRRCCEKKKKQSRANN